MLSTPDGAIRIGDLAAFPLGRLGGEEPAYRHRWAVHSFRPDGCIEMRRLHDGFSRVISPHWFKRYALQDRPADRQGFDRRLAALSAMRTRRRLAVRLQDDRSATSFYVSARKGKDWRPLAGPFRDYATAAIFVEDCRRLAGQFYSDPALEIGYGVAKCPDGSLIGLFNDHLFGHLAQA